jgi:hypothetical protein
MAIDEPLDGQPVRSDQPGEADGGVWFVEKAEGEDEPSEENENCEHGG